MQTRNRSTSISSEDVNNALTPTDRRRILEGYGFDFSRATIDSSDRASRVLGPKALGEGETPNFKVDLSTGYVKDWGGSGYEGSNLYQVVADLEGLGVQADFPEVLRIVAEKIGMDVPDAPTSRGDHASTPPPPPVPSTPPEADTRAAPDDAGDTIRPSVGGNNEPVATPEQIKKGTSALWADTDTANAAARYLLEKRGLDINTIRGARLMLGSGRSMPCSHSIVIPVADRMNGGTVKALKAFGFNPDARDWARDEDGEKIPRNTGSTALLDVIPSTPDASPVLVCEGELDALCARSHGLNAVSGTGGAGTFKPEWAAYLAKLKAVNDHGCIVAFDGDDTGRKNAPKVAQKLYAAGIRRVRIADLPDEQDVSDVLNENGTAALLKLLMDATPYPADEPAAEGEGDAHDADEDKLEIHGPLVDAHGIEWGPPVPLHDAGDPDPIPLHTLPSWMRDHIESVAGAVQVPADLPALLTLCATAGALQKKAVVTPRVGWREPLTLWGMGVLPSGARKSPTFKKITTPITDHEMLLREQVEQQRTEALDMQEVLEDRLNAAKKAAVKADDLSEAEAAVQAARDELDAHEVPSMPALWSDDATSEALQRDMAANDGRMLVMSPEGDFLKFMAGRYDSSSTVLNLYKKAFTGNEGVRDSRMGREGNDMSNPALSVAICAQPTVLQDLAQKRTFRGEGLLARFLYVVPPSNVGNRLTGADVPPLDTAAKATFEKRLTDLWEVTPKTIEEDGTWSPHVLRLQDRARVVFHDFEDEVEAMLKPGAELDGLQDWGSKMVGQMLRLAGLIHISTHGPTKAMSTKVGPDTIAKATEVTRALSTHMRRAYALLEANERTQLAAYLWRRICTISDVTPIDIIDKTPRKGISGNTVNIVNVGCVSKRKVWRASQGKSDLTSVDDLDAPLHLLEEHRLIKVVTPETSGPGRPPSPRIHINPLAVEG